MNSPRSKKKINVPIHSVPGEGLAPVWSHLDLLAEAEALAPRGSRTPGTHLKDIYASVLAARVPSLMSTRRLGDRDWWLLSDTSIKPATQLPSYESQRVLNHPPILSSCTLIPRDFLRSWLSVSQKGAEKVSSNRDQSQLIQHKKNQTQD